MKGLNLIFDRKDLCSAQACALCTEDSCYYKYRCYQECRLVTGESRTPGPLRLLMASAEVCYRSGYSQLVDAVVGRTAMRCRKKAQTHPRRGADLFIVLSTGRGLSRKREVPGWMVSVRL
jgi:hypothetical protein